ncbi:hypothetical protein FKW77_008712 [Venturia effusa]|uniref:Major facilitator superfamily (MFS) profile domain-containing protein n=1 Tax=Venturia effusa TaxID=50376 RepID=A0A517LHS8_9PEZI|nr:hypothetical protein FKW77_008712 [Venturia effusa]
MRSPTPYWWFRSSIAGLALDSMGHIILRRGVFPAGLFHEGDIQGATRPSLYMDKCILEDRADKSAAERLPTSKIDIANAIKKFIRTSLTRPVHMLLSEPIAGLFSLYIAFNFAVQYSFFVAFPTVFEDVYGFDLGSQGLTFLGLGVGILVAVLSIIINSKFVYAPLALRWKKRHPRAQGESKTKSAASTPPPEYRLFTAFPGSMLIPIALFLFAWTARRSIHWIVPIIAEALFGIGQVLDFMSCTMYLMDTYGPLYGASAMAANTLLRYTVGFAFPLLRFDLAKVLAKIFQIATP